VKLLLDYKWTKLVGGSVQLGDQLTDEHGFVWTVHSCGKWLSPDFNEDIQGFLGAVNKGKITIENQDDVFDYIVVCRKKTLAASKKT
jgi:hypothetical protein